MKYLFFALLLCSGSLIAHDVDWAKFSSNRGYLVRHVGDKTGNQYLVHTYLDSIDVNPNAIEYIEGIIPGRNTVISKLSPDGELLWSYNWPYEHSEEIPISIYRFQTDNYGNTFVSGILEYPMDMDAGDDVDILTPSTEDSDFFLMKIDENGDYLWSKIIASDGGPAHLTDIKITSSNDLFLYGYFGGAFDIDPSDDLDPIEDLGGKDNFIARMDDDGNVIWIKSFGGVSIDFSGEMEIGNDDDIWMVGVHVGTVDVNPSPADTEWITAVGSIDTYILHLNADGEYIEHFSYAGDGYDQITDIELNTAEELIVLGNFDGDELDLDPTEEGVDIHTSDAPEYYTIKFCQKINLEGTVAWTNNFGWMDASMTYLETGREDEIYIGGTFTADFDIDPTDSEAILVNIDDDPLHNDCFIGVFNTNGGLINVWNFSQETGSRMVAMYSDDNGDLYLSTDLRTNTVFDCNPSEEEEYILPGILNSDNPIIKFSSDYYSGLNELPQGDFALYPNPSNGSFVIQSEDLNNAVISVYSLTGELVYTKQWSGDFNKLDVNLNLSPGVFLLQLNSANTEIRKKLIIR